MMDPMCVLYGDLSVLKRTSRLGRNTLASPNSGANSAGIAFIAESTTVSYTSLRAVQYALELPPSRPSQNSRASAGRPRNIFVSVLMAGVDPVGADERGGSAFLGHGPVVGVPVVVLAAGGGVVRGRARDGDRPARPARRVLRLPPTASRRGT